MKPSGLIEFVAKSKLPLILLALVGAAFILVSTSRFGAGLSPDSVGYIGTARNLINGAGFINYDGNPTVIWPPLYPALLALLGGISGIDPLNLAIILNALIFGLIVLAGGGLSYKHFSTFPILALVGTLAILVSSTLFEVSVMAWTEPLFILCVLLCFILVDSYLSKNDITTLSLLSASVALATLTRYIGVTLILWGALIILVFHRARVKDLLIHLAIFTLISALPLGIWLIRNYTISSTLFGDRASSAFTVSKNFNLVFNSLLDWYIPNKIADHRPYLMIVSVVAGFFAGLSLRDSWQGLKVRLRQASPMILFVILYTVFLVISSNITATDPIDNRLLSPIYAPLTLLFLIFIYALVEPYGKRFPRKMVYAILIIGLAIWFIYPIRSTILKAIHSYPIGQGYNRKDWIDSETVQYLLQNRPITSECKVYTNDPAAAYILAHLQTKRSPAKTRYNSPEIVNDITNLKGTWPEEKNACLVWFDKNIRAFLFSIEELKTVVNMDLIVQLEDGAFYTITKK